MINKKEVQHIAKLARLGLSLKEEESFRKDLSEILDYFKIIQPLDTSKIEPTFHPTENFLLEKGNIFRQDKENKKSSELSEKLIELAPEKKEGYIKVKTVLKEYEF